MSQDDYFVRPLQESDLSEWFRLRRLLWDEASDEDHKEEMLEIFEDPEFQLIVVCDAGGGRLVGFLEASIRPFVEDCESDQVGYLEGWFVENEFRRRGIGKRLVRAAEDWARSKGCTEMASDSEIGNELGLDAHLGLGYEVTSKLVHLRKELD